MTPAYLLLRQLPLARRQAAIRAALPEIINLLEAAHNAVGFPKEHGWSPVLAHDLEALRQAIINPPNRLNQEV